MKLQKKIYIVIVLLLGSINVIHTIPVGSNAAAAKQARSFFPKSQNDNKMTGFSVFESGVILEDSTTICEFDAFFPIAGNVILNGGILSLLRDLTFKSPLQLGSGTLKGNGFAVEFPGNVSNLQIPTPGYEKTLNEVDQVSVGYEIKAVDWSYDGAYVALCTLKAGSNDEIYVYSVSNDSLTFVTSYDPGDKDIHTLSWHPSDYYLAFGQRDGTELKILQFNAGVPSLSLVSSKNLASRVYAVAWSPNGNYLAVGKYNKDEFLVYSVNNGVIGNEYDIELGDAATVGENAIDWDPTGAYIVVGFSITPHVRVFSFNGSTLALNASLDVGAAVEAVSWRNTSSFIAIGSAGTQERVRILAHDAGAGTLTDQTSAYIGEGKSVFGVHWSPDGTSLAVGKDNDANGFELAMYNFDATDVKLNLMSGISLSDEVNDVRWSPSGSHVLLGESDSDMLRLYSFVEQIFTFDDIIVFFNSDILVKTPIYFKGECAVNGSGNTLQLDGGSIVIESGAHLMLDNMKIKGINATNIRCADDTSVLTLRNATWVQDNNFTFTQGALQFKDDVIMRGDYIFAYQTVQTSTLLAKSMLELDVNFTFSYDPATNRQDLLQCNDNTSLLSLNGATLHTTMTGLQLTNGKLMVKRDSFLSSETETIGENTIDNGIIFGDGAGGNDFVCEILSGVALQIKQGSLNYKNVNVPSWNMIGDRSLLRLKDNTALRLYENLTLGEGSVSFGNNTTLARVSGKRIIGNVDVQGALGFTTLSSP